MTYRERMMMRREKQAARLRAYRQQRYNNKLALIKYRLEQHLIDLHELSQDLETISPAHAQRIRELITG